MKKSLIILSLMGLSATQVNASVQQTFEPTISTSLASVSNTSITPVKSFTVVNNFSNISSNTIQRVQNIEYLNNQAQQKSDELAQLSRQLESKFTTSTSFATSANNPSIGSVRLTSSAPPALAASRAARAASSNSMGLCAKYVRIALQAAGYSFTPNESAYQYATRGTLAEAGFIKLNNDSYQPQVGDVAVFNRSSKNPHGHIQIYDGSQWVSDFRQSKFSPYSSHNGYSVWRDSRYLDASNKGTYLAMND
ncbi:CHAP domain-containing protein [Psychrobacter sp.]|uniref:CHAP domain-containing protein n=1 Tax=Psychrobacter sp. TaxID=56811 RepID=UPI0025FD176B|nr:CHAP domain-containing protein [Psychrobacter sp.]